jgi:hypothetical protein
LPVAADVPVRRFVRSERQVFREPLRPAREAPPSDVRILAAFALLPQERARFVLRWLPAEQAFLSLVAGDALLRFFARDWAVAAAAAVDFRQAGCAE